MARIKSALQRWLESAEAERNSGFEVLDASTWMERHQ